MKTTTRPNPSTQKTTISKFALVIAGILFPLFMKAQNLVTNSSFNNGTTSRSTNCTIEVNPETVYGGSDATNPATEIDMERCINQNICIMAGVTYKLSFRAARRIDAQTPSNPGIVIKVKGVNSNTTYVNQTASYNSTTWKWVTTTYTFTVPANSTDKNINIAFTDNNNHATFGVLIDDIEIRPSTELTINGVSDAVLNTTYNYSVSNSPASDISYNWNMGANATPATSTSATPSTKWTAVGFKNMSVAISNGSCVAATITKTIAVTASLPVTFTNFTGIVKDNKTALSWSTASELNNNYFIVERSLNGRSFDSVGRVNAGTTSANTYSYTENNSNSVSYYRLKQVDVNGTYIYSTVITLKNSGSSKEMTIYPSQASSTIQYVVSNEGQATATVLVFNMAGQPVITQKEVLQSGLNIRTLNVSQLATGAYVLKVAIPASGVNEVKKFTKM
jgi:hypothetical protein